jgi:E3 ubiquitin-protein ligase DOA10
MEVKGTSDLEYEGVPDQDAIQCRICWSGEDDSSNPLILACKCKGTVGLIHF